MIDIKKTIESRYEKEESEYAPIQRTTLTTEEVAKYLGVSRDLVYKLCREKKIPHIKIGARIMFKISTIDKWLSDLEENSYEY